MRVLRFLAALSSIAAMAALPGVLAAATGPPSRPGNGAAIGNRTSQQTPGLSGEDATAASLLLAASDYPAGWTELPRGGQPDILGQCTPDVPGRTGLARGATYSPDRGVRAAAETVSVLDNQTDAAQSASLLVGVLDCSVAALKEMEASDTHVTDASYSAERFPMLGDESVAYRLHITMENEQSGAMLDDFIDVVYVVNGRVGFSIQAGGLSAPLDPNLLAAIVAQANAKVQGSDAAN